MYLPELVQDDPGGYVIAQLIATLQAAIVLEPWAEKFAPVGVMLTAKPAEALAWVRSKRPFYFLEVASLEEDDSAVIADGTRWSLEISIEAVSNKDTSIYEDALKAALISILHRASTDLEALAIEESDIRAGQGKRQDPSRINPHTFGCVVYTTH